MRKRPHHSLLDLCCSLFREGDRQDSAGVDTFLADQPGEALNQNAGFARSRTGDNANILPQTMRGIDLPFAENSLTGFLRLLHSGDFITARLAKSQKSHFISSAGFGSMRPSRISATAFSASTRACSITK